MANFNYEIIGLIAAAITTFAWVPQVYKMYSEKNHDTNKKGKKS